MKPSTVVIQARVTSSRLPGKVLMPVGGVPLAVLAAKRAANTGRNVVVATSTDPADDALVEILERAGISYYRGSLENVLERFIGALSSQPDDAHFFRLTADNALPDGALLDEMEDQFLQEGARYMGIQGAASGLPYGVGAEITSVGFLREAHRENPSEHDKEHVTPSIKERYGFAHFTRYRHMAAEDHRCTVDTLDDYLQITKLFRGVADPITESCASFVEKLRRAGPEQTNTARHPKFILGTAQLTRSYGITHSGNAPSDEHALALAQAALESGAFQFDTAPSYGDSERVLGALKEKHPQFRPSFFTKIDGLEEFSENSEREFVNAFVDRSIYRSLYRLRSASLDGVLLHRASDLTRCGGKILNRLEELREIGCIKAIGVSVQDEAELDSALLNASITLVQLPSNILDWRWSRFRDQIHHQKQVRELSIVARSVFLQGLLTSRDDAKWQRANCADSASVIDWIDAAGEYTGIRDVRDLCIRYVNSLDWIDALVIGVENEWQLQDNLLSITAPKLSDEALTYFEQSRPRLPAAVLDPKFWSK